MSPSPMFSRVFRYEDVNSILREFFTLRLEFYDKRKVHLEGLLGAESSRLSNQARSVTVGRRRGVLDVTVFEANGEVSNH